MSDTLIEAVARAITYVEGCGPLAGCKICADPQREDSCLHAARAAIAAIEASGTHRVVPVFPTDTMSAAARNASVANGSPASKGPEDVYAAMLAVAPKVAE